MHLLPWLRTFDAKKYIKSIVYGGLDGIVTTFSMVASSNGAAIPTSLLFIIGFANLIADALSMSVGDFLSSKAEVEYQQTREHAKMKDFDSHLEVNKKIVFQRFKSRGFSDKDCNSLVEILIKDKKTFVEFLLLDEEEEEDSSQSAAWTFLSFIGFGFLPLLTYIAGASYSLADQGTAFWWACFLTAATLGCLGILKNKITGQPKSATAGAEMVMIGFSAAVMAYLIAWILSSYSQHYNVPVN